jgi:FkbH-like protein
MTLIDALERINTPIAEDAPTMKVFLACGFTPLHVQTFVTARLREAFPRARADIITGLYGDLAVALDTAAVADVETVMVIVEWQDLDPRLGLRALGGWRVADLANIAETAARQAQRIAGSIERIALRCATVVALPTLPLPPLFPTRPGQGGPDELRLRRTVAELGAALADTSGVRLVGAQKLDLVSPLAGRLNAGSDIAAGFPYSLSHASALTEALVALVGVETPMKGLITDLDDTLWAGLLGEVGVDGIAWTLEDKAQAHGLYQQFLASLASAGVLIGIASKNDPALVEEAFAGRDLLLPKELAYPIAAGWGPKSASVGRILAAWNIGADAVVFVDDSPMELAEVGAAFPAMICRRFPGRDPQALLGFLQDLRGLFGKSEIRREDNLRLASIRGGAAFGEAGAGAAPEEFLKSVGGSIRFAMGRSDTNGRAFELVNKTNQFNLNGERLSAREWSDFLGDETAFLLTANYRDKFGDLGKIGALLGRRLGDRVVVDAWVLSCRAFSRRIEHETVRRLFKTFGVEEILFNFQATQRNGPTADFLAAMTGARPVSKVTLRRRDFLELAPAPVHTLESDADG